MSNGDRGRVVEHIEGIVSASPPAHKGPSLQIGFKPGFEHKSTVRQPGQGMISRACWLGLRVKKRGGQHLSRLRVW